MAFNPMLIDIFNRSAFNDTKKLYNSKAIDSMWSLYLDTKESIWKNIVAVFFLSFGHGCEVHKG